MTDREQLTRAIAVAIWDTFRESDQATDSQRVTDFMTLEKFHPKQAALAMREASAALVVIGTWGLR